MPELPEVETIKRDLEKIIINKTITDVFTSSPKVIKGISAKDFDKQLKGKKITEIIRKGKILIFGLSSGKFLLVHLRIAGWIIYGQKQERSRVAIKLSDKTFINYMDQRLLGELKIADDYLSVKFIKNLGPDPLSMGLNDFKRIISASSRNIKVLLLDQSIIAGIGNIYAQEALFRSGILPQRKSNSLTDSEVKMLFQEIRAVLKEGIKHRGSSVDLYRDPSGNKGGMERRLKVYGRKGENCCSCDGIIEKISVGGRGTCFCPKCQK